MNNILQLSASGNILITGTMDEVIEVLQAWVPSPRFSPSKAAIEAGEIGSVVKVTSRVKGNGASAQITVVGVGGVVPESDGEDYAPVQAAPAEEVAEVAEAVVESAPVVVVGACPDGVRKASWKCVVAALEGVVVETVVTRKVTDKRFDVMVNGERLWYSNNESVARAMADAVEVNFMASAQ